MHGTAYNRTPSDPMELSRETWSEVEVCYSLRRDHEEHKQRKQGRCAFQTKGMVYMQNPSSRRELGLSNKKMKSTSSGALGRSSQIK